MESADLILAAREERDALATQLAKRNVVVSVHANVPGQDKNLAEAYLLVRHFSLLTQLDVCDKILKIGGMDGFAVLLAFSDVSAQFLKAKTVEIEQDHPLGRFVDIDVFPKGGANSLTRGHMRKCFLCDNPAFVCRRLGSHSTESLVSALVKETDDFFTRQLVQAVKDALTAELDLENKFGLVSPTSSGSHDDMDYETMKLSQEAIAPYLAQMFFEGARSQNAHDVLAKLRPPGVCAERAMLEANGDVNAYKGFVFVGGVVLSAAGYLATHEGQFVSAQDCVRAICKDVMAEFDGKVDSFGKVAYAKYRFGGVRKHASEGFETVFAAEKLLSDDFSQTDMLQTLTYIVGKVDDSVLLKRCGSMEKYLDFKKRISEVDVGDAQALAALNAECVQNRVSIGGSADVLAAAVLVKKLKKLLLIQF